MSMRFKNDRLLVGYTREEWHEVWFKPESATEDGGATLGLFRAFKRRKDEHFRVPKEGEIVWNAFWNPKECGTAVKGEMRLKHQQLLGDAWSYLHEKDPRELAAIRRRLESNGPSNKCQAWFAEAKKWKSKQMKQIAARQRRRQQGEGDEDEADKSSSSDSDSGNDPDSPDGAAAAARELGEQPSKRGPRPPRGRARRGNGGADDSSDDNDSDGQCGARRAMMDARARRDYGSMGPPPVPSHRSSAARSSSGSTVRGLGRAARASSTSSTGTDRLFVSEKGTPGPNDPPMPGSLMSGRSRAVPGGAEGIRQSREFPANKRQRTSDGMVERYGTGRTLNSIRAGSQERPFSFDDEGSEVGDDQYRRIAEPDDDVEELDGDAFREMLEANDGLDEKAAFARAVRESTADLMNEYSLARGSSVPGETPAPE